MNATGAPAFPDAVPGAGSHAPADLAAKTIGEIGEALRAGAVTSRRLIEACLAQIQQSNPIVNCFVSVDEAGALSAARAFDEELAAGRDRGALHGIPVAIKDIIDVAGQVTTSGSALFEDRVAEADAACVARLKTAGAIIVGKTVLHEFAYGITGDRSAHGASRNPHDLARMSGGSSGGSAVAVAAGLVPLALGTDTAGSVRVPAALCGVVGLKPAYGAIDEKGVHPLSTSLDHVGIFARCVRDAELTYDILADRRQVPEPTGEKPRLGWVVASDFGPIEPAIETALAAVVARCGFAPTRVAIEDAPQLFSVLTAIQSYEAYRAHADDLRRGAAARIDDEVRQRLKAGVRITDTTYRDALRFRDRFRGKMAAILERYDVLAMPTVPMLAPRIGERTPDIAGKTVEVRAALLSLTSPWNLSGVPAISIPAGTIGALPFGLQLICAAGRERTLFDVGARIERVKQ